MKNRIATAIILGISGLLFITGPRSIFKVCSSEEMVMNCHWTIQAEIGIGILLIVTGGLYLFAAGLNTRLFLLLQSAAIFLIGILIPAVLIGGCKSKDMACQSLTFPALYLISALGLLYITGTVLYLFGRISQRQQ